ncbi:MAG: restriction endonuclease [Janthinobacterium lividum]
MTRVALPLFLLLMPTAGVAESARIGPSFVCPRPAPADRLSQLICDNADMSREELTLAQSYQALRHLYGPNGWKALRAQAASFDTRLRAACNVPASSARHRTMPPGVPACYVARTETDRAIWLERMSGPAREEASRPVEQAMALQQRLVDLGFLAAGTEADGVYGDATRTAIMTWQRVARRSDATGFMSDADAVALRSPVVAADMFRTATMVLACSDLRAGGVYAIAPDRSDGRCFEALPAQRWEKVSEERGLLLLRRVPAVVGEPPLYFRAQDVTIVVDRRPLAPIPKQEILRTKQPEQPATGSGFIGRIAVAVLAIAGMLLGLGTVRRLHGARARRRRVRKAFELAMKEVATHQRTLQIRKLQLVGVDAYGTIDLAKWNKERAYFYKTRIMPLLAANALDDQWALINGEVEHRLELAASAPGKPEAALERFVSDPRIFDPRMEPADYERHCAMLLRAAGWKAQVTAASGDQGTDVLARRAGRTLVLQCKLYSNPVGNSAVQEISAARLHQRADLAAVVSNASFTPAARQLARTNGVYLIHHEELRAFDRS